MLSTGLDWMSTQTFRVVPHTFSQEWKGKWRINRSPNQMNAGRKEPRRVLLQPCPKNYERKKMYKHANKVRSPDGSASVLKRAWRDISVCVLQGLLSSLQLPPGDMGTEVSCITFTRAPWGKAFSHRWDRWHRCSTQCQLFVLPFFIFFIIISYQVPFEARILPNAIWLMRGRCAWSSLARTQTTLVASFGFYYDLLSLSLRPAHSPEEIHSGLFLTHLAITQSSWPLVRTRMWTDW